MTWQFALAGLAVGVLVGLTGMGGGSLMTPMLILLFGFDAKTAVGTDILHGAIFKSFGAVRHRQLGNVHTRLALWMLAGSAPLSLVGVEIASSFGDGAESAMSKLVGATLIVGGVGFLVKTFLHPHEGKRGFDMTTRDRIAAVLIGATFGFVVGLTSVGSGTFFGLAMLLFFPLTARRIVGTDLLHAALLLWVAGAGHLLHGNVDLHAMAWLLVGSIPGVLRRLSALDPRARPGAARRLLGHPHAVRDQAARGARGDGDHRGHGCHRPGLLPRLDRGEPARPAVEPRCGLTPRRTTERNLHYPFRVKRRKSCVKCRKVGYRVHRDTM